MSHQSPSTSARFGLPPNRLSGALSRAVGRIVAFLLAAMLVAAPATVRGAGESGEYEEKARRISAFITHTEWPQKKLGRGDAPFIIGIYGSDQISGYLQEIYAGSLYKGHPVQIRSIFSRDDIPSCHLLFVSGSEKDRLSSILREARREGILTVGETDNFLESGGIIQFVRKPSGGWSYTFNKANADREHLKLGAFILFSPLQKPSAIAPRENVNQDDAKSDRRIADTPE